MKIRRTLLRILVSRWTYYCITAVFLVFFGWKILPYLVEIGVINIDLSLNLLSEIFGLLFTLLVLVAIFELREEFRWRRVKEKVLDRISTQLRFLFIQITHLVEFEWSTNPYAILEELDSKEVLKFSEEGMKLLTGGNLPKLLEDWVVSFGELEERYYRFLESRLELSLMEIQTLLKRLRSGIVQYQYLPGRIIVSEDLQQKKLLSTIDAIIGEISTIKELGLDFWARG